MKAKYGTTQTFPLKENCQNYSTKASPRKIAAFFEGYKGGMYSRQSKRVNWLCRWWEKGFSRACLAALQRKSRKFTEVSPRNSVGGSTVLQTVEATWYVTIRRRGRGYESQQYLKGVVGKACNRSRPVRTEKEGYDLNYSTKIATKKKKKKNFVNREDR